MAAPDRPQGPTDNDFRLPAVAAAAKRILEKVQGAEEMAEALLPVLTEAGPEIQICLAGLIQQQLIASYKAVRPRRKLPIDPLRANGQCLGIAETILADNGYFPKLARWVAVNVCFWLWEGDSTDVIDGQSVGSLIRVYAEGSAQVVGKMLSPPHRPIAQLEDILGLSTTPGVPPAIGEIPQGMLPVLSARHFHRLREALYKNSFRRTADTPWPTASLSDDGKTAFAQLRPPASDGDGDLWLPHRQREAWAEAMWRQQSELSDKDADALDALCAIYLSQARTPDDAAVADIDQILALRGLKPKVGGCGRRGGYEMEQREEVRQALLHIQNLWLTIAQTTTFDGPAPITKTLQSRPFLITDQMGRSRRDGTLEMERFIFRPGKAFAAFLLGSGRHLLFQKALQYDPYRKKWEKRLARYLSWQWGVSAAEGDFVQSHDIAALLNAVGEPANDRYPAKTRGRLETALATLLADGIIAAWHYAEDPVLGDRRRWLAAWFGARVVIEAPQPLKDYYARQRQQAPWLSPSTLAPLGARVREYRRICGLTQRQLAHRLGVQQGHLSKIERGQAFPSARLGKAIEGWLAE